MTAPATVTLGDDRPAARPAPGPRSAAGAGCRHCGLPVPDHPAAGGFCCAGCAAAYDLVRGLGLEGYYRRRAIDPQQPALRPDPEAAAIDFADSVSEDARGVLTVHLLIEGLHCAACVWLIESVLAHQPGVVAARVNMTSRRLTVSWRADETSAGQVTAPILALGYRLVPFDPELIGREGRRRERALLRAVAVAGFAAGNVMLLSISVWAGHVDGMGPATRGLFHWLSALIALPAIAYAGRPFFRSALAALRAGRLNMDVPISLAVVLAAGMSLHQTAVGAVHAYFDSAVTLLFFLLIGRWLDLRARGRARSAAEQLLALGGRPVTVLDPGGERRLVAPRQVVPGARVLVAAGERIGVDGIVESGASDVDTALIDGETIPTPAVSGVAVFAGTVNRTAPLTLTVTAVGDQTLLAEITRLVEAAEQGRGRYVALADRIARLYAPVVHGLALATFAGWLLVAGVAWQAALLNAIAVLIITCPCALALAVPAVQVAANGRLLRNGVLVKSPTALERLADVDTVMVDKTGTLTPGRPELVNAGEVVPEVLIAAARLAAASRHPLARALVRAAEAAGPPVSPVAGVREVTGQGLERDIAGKWERLGSARFCDVAIASGDTASELWYRPADGPAVRFAFADPLRSDAAATVRRLTEHGYQVVLASGDRAPVVAVIAAAVGIADAAAAQSPVDKVRRLDALAAAGKRVAMVGDGLNDAPALAAAHASLSPSSAVDLSQTAADVVFQGARLAPVADVLALARVARRRARENLALAFAYNLVTIPLAVAGLVTPLIAAVAMSTSSLVVIANALRVGRSRLP